MSKAEKKVKVQEEEFDDNMGRLKLQVRLGLKEHANLSLIVKIDEEVCSNAISDFLSAYDLSCSAFDDKDENDFSYEGSY